MDVNHYNYIHQRSVAFKDTDMAGIVHFTQLLAYAEEAEHAALLSVGVMPISSEGGFPKVHVDCDYRSPGKFGDLIEVRIGIRSISESSSKWEFEMVAADKKICEGSLVTVYVNSAGKSEPINDVTKSALQALFIT